jgi:hypothetical protein
LAVLLKRLVERFGFDTVRDLVAVLNGSSHS